MHKLFSRIMLHPYPFRGLAMNFIRRLHIGSYEDRVMIGAVDRPYYAYCLYQGAVLAKKLGYPRISVLEFGVANGAGLLNLEYHAQRTSKAVGIDISIYGFDTAEGLPDPVDYRDLPYHWKKEKRGQESFKGSFRGRPRKRGQKRGQESFKGSFRGRPRGRNSDSSPSRAATDACHEGEPNGWPR